MTTPIQQSGLVTAGHVAVWLSPGIIADGGNLVAAQKVLASIRGADFNNTADQPLLLPAGLTAFQITAILITNAAVSLTTAVGGFYPLPFKGGTPIVAAGQAYSSLTDTTKLLSATLAGAVATTRYSKTNVPNAAIFLSLTTPQGAAASADVYLIGTDLS